MAIYPTNDPKLVDEIIHALGASGDEQVPGNKGVLLTLREALLKQYQITAPTPKLLRTIAERTTSAVMLRELQRGRHDAVRRGGYPRGLGIESHHRSIKPAHAPSLARRCDAWGQARWYPLRV